jgi:hypothetical protein
MSVVEAGDGEGQAAATWETVHAHVSDIAEAVEVALHALETVTCPEKVFIALCLPGGRCDAVIAGALADVGLIGKDVSCTGKAE